ncbi:MAG: DUF4290 domain-containing protein [Paludibacteraceae bacterium]|nr:DUF4290 domain-containing protein [Paludibacteraceae bacterium]
MEYYTAKNKLILPEYGRNIQQMVEYAMTIEDRGERTRCVKTIISIMGNLFPHLRDVNDFKHKLWDHLAMMSDYRLDIDYPYDIPKKEDAVIRPVKINYPDYHLRYRHYGRTLPALVKAAADYEGEDKQLLVSMVANQMKKSYLAWNKDNVEDKKIYDDLRELSDGRLDYNEETLRLRDARELQLVTKNKPNVKGGKNFKGRK